MFTLLGDRLCVLLARRLEEPQRGLFALPGGFVGTEESPAQTAERKLREKTGVGSVHLEQLRTYADPRRDPRGWLPSIAYLALVGPEELPEEGPAEREAGWHPVDDLPELALDHETIVDRRLSRLRARVTRRPGSCAWRARCCRPTSRSARRSGSTRPLGRGRRRGRLSAATSRRPGCWSTPRADSDGPGRPGRVYRRL